jgi:kynurenine formamidase
MTEWERTPPTRDDVVGYLTERNNWGRWGDDDQLGTYNLLTPERIVAATRLVTKGRSVSMSRDFPTDKGVHNWNPAEQYWHWAPKKMGGGYSMDYFALNCHGVTCTHLDAICHTWDDNGMYNGRDPEQEMTTTGSRWGGIEHWKEGFIARGVMLDVPRHRGTPYVTLEEPVHGWELDDILSERGIELEAGDVVCVYSGRDAWQKDNPDKPYYRVFTEEGYWQAPGLNASCLPFLRDHDVSMIIWDMLDAEPDPSIYGLPYTIHGAISAYGLALLDNAQLEPLAQACIEEGRDEFMVVAVPLLMRGATGSPINPIAVF